MKFSILSLAALSLALSSAPAFAASVLFSDLGTGSNVFSATGYAVAGSAAFPGLILPSGYAMPFIGAGAGDEIVSQIDLGVAPFSNRLHTFTASIWTDVSGLPGSQVACAFWTLSATVTTCCTLITQAGISGVTLTGGQQYFMVLQPVSYLDSSIVLWGWNTLGPADTLGAIDGDYAYSPDGISWLHETGPIGAFDVLGDPVPEPASFALSATGLAALLALRRRGAGR